MRLFIAIKLNDDMKAGLASMQEAMKRRGVKGNYTIPANLHITLAFIGEYDDPQAVLRAIRQVSLEPFGIRLSGTGTFRSLWWAGVDGGNALFSYAKRLRHALDDAGIPYDHDKFTPHITLIRRPHWKSEATRDEILAEAAAASDASMTVARLALMRSDRKERGVEYIEIT